MTVKKIGEKIKKAIKESNLTQEDTAKKLKISRQQICNWIHNRNTPTINLLNEIIKITGKDANYFFGLPSYTVNNPLVGNKQNTLQTTIDAAEFESIKQDIALLKKVVIELQDKEK